MLKGAYRYAYLDFALLIENKEPRPSVSIHVRYLQPIMYILATSSLVALRFLASLLRVSDFMLRPIEESKSDNLY